MKCTICKKEIKYYGKEKSKNHKRTRCGACSTKLRRYRSKQAAIELLGGQCERCGWKGDQAAFEFHHKDPTQKDFNIGQVANKSWSFIVREIKKCELLCSNCHRIEHTNRDSEEFLKTVYDYRGNQFQLEKPTTIKQCNLCGKDYEVTHKKQKYCSQKCSSYKARKVFRPEKDQLKKDVEQLGYVGTGKKYGVSDNAIRKWLK